jgi:hypothetical protein
LPTTNGRCLHFRVGATPDPEVKELYRLLHLTEKVMSPVHRWSDTGK